MTPTHKLNKTEPELTVSKDEYVLMISKWYPYDKDPQFGVFIQKQAIAISNFREIVVYSSHSHSEKVKGRFKLEITKKNRLTEYRMYYKKNSSLLSPALNAIYYIIAWRKSKKEIWKNHGTPVLLHVYILLRPAVLVYLCSLVYKIPFVISEQWSGYTNGKFNAKTFLVRWLSKFFFKKAKARIVVSTFLRSSMTRLGFSSDILVIPNIIETQVPPSLRQSDKIKILLVADLVDEIKNISGVISAFSQVLKEVPDLSLQIIGHGKDEEKLKQLASQLKLSTGSLVFSGLKSNAEVYDALWHSDFLVMNSRFETFSLICAEALSCGKPVIATRCGGPEEFINESNGILIPIDDETALKNAILMMCQTRQNYPAQKLMQESAEKFGSKVVGAKLNAIYETLL